MRFSAKREEDVSPEKMALTKEVEISFKYASSKTDESDGGAIFGDIGIRDEGEDVKA